MPTEEEDQAGTRGPRTDAKTVKQPPPGNPVCAAGNPLCPTNPAQPATVVTSGGDLTNETAAWSNQQYQNALNATGSVINASTTGTYNWFTASISVHPSMGSAAKDDICLCISEGYGTGLGLVGLAAASGMAGTLAVVSAGGLLIEDIANGQASDNPFVRMLAGAGTAQPPDDDGNATGAGGGDIPTNRKGEKYPQIADPRTGQPIKYPGSNLKQVPKQDRVNWDSSSDRYSYIKEWYDRGYDTPEGGWADYDIHHIQPREYGGTNDFDNLVPVRRDLHQQQFNKWWTNY